MPCNYKLTYFDAKSRAEVIRLMFHAADVKFEDVRIGFADWPALKPKVPFGQLPVLEIDGCQLGQSQAIERHLAKEFGFAGETAMDQALCDAYCCALIDLRQPFMDSFFESDEAKKAKMLKGGVEKAPMFLAPLEKRLEHHDFLLGHKLTRADIALMNCMDWGLVKSNIPSSVMDKHPKIKAHIQRIKDVRGIKEWIKKRPDTQL